MEKWQAHPDEVAQIVSGRPGLNTTQVMDQMQTTTQRSERSSAVQAAKGQGLIHDQQVGREKRLYPGSGLPDWPNGGQQM